MKKIILTALTVLMMFGLIGCSGDLHDYKDPEMFTGAWYYYDVGTDAENLIFNISGGNQSSNIEGIDVSAGSVYYAWDSTLTQNDVGNNKVYEPDDKPESRAGRVWCYTNAKSTPNCYWWVGDNNPGWPGKPMAKAGEEPVVVPVYTITFVVDGFDPKETVVVNGTIWGWNGWPFVSWNENNQEKTTAWINKNKNTQIFKADDAGIIVFTVEFEATGAAEKIMFVKSTVAEGVYSSGTQTGDISVPLPEEAGSYTARITFEPKVDNQTPTPAVVF